ncbi:MAG: hypothetical protein ABR964_10030 [Tepidisphaeraceae bacterium]
MKIVLFEDSQQYEQELLKAMKDALSDRDETIIFRARQPKANVKPVTYETRLEQDLSDAGHLDASLIVADLDLSALSLYGGLSELQVRRVAERFGIPECCYARGENEGRELLRSAELGEARIAVSLKEGNQEFAKQVVSIAKGFALIESRLPDALKTSGKKSPGKLLAATLGKPEYAEKIALYASGDQNRLASVLGVKGSDNENLRRLTCLLGYWLWDSILRYPGVVANEVAASSYLNIHEDSFRTNPDIQRLFAKARYDGPFAEAKGPLWWRGVLDDIVATSGASDGRDFAAKQLRQQVERSQCCEDPSKPAGYYCMLSKKPVSLENSKGGLTWFPRGADLARISRSKYEEDVPWF